MKLENQFWEGDSDVAYHKEVQVVKEKPEPQPGINFRKVSKDDTRAKLIAKQLNSERNKAAHRNDNPHLLDYLRRKLETQIEKGEKMKLVSADERYANCTVDLSGRKTLSQRIMMRP